MKQTFLLMLFAVIIAGCGTETAESDTEESVEEAVVDEDAVEEETEDNTAEEEQDEKSAKEDEDESDGESLEESEEENTESNQEEDDEQTEEEMAEEETDENQDAVGDSKYIDVLSQLFINEFFSGPDSYVPNEISLGMSQSEIESIYGVHDTHYQLEGANLAIYGNMALLYSEGFPAGDGGFPDIDPDNNFVTDAMIYMNIPHQTVVNAYGEPTVDYYEYELRGPGEQSMIYDSTRGNGYAVFIEMSGDTAMVMRKGEEWDLEQLMETEANIEEMQEDEYDGM